MRKGRTNMSPGISISARVIIFLPQSAREYGTWPKKSQWEILRIFWPISFLHNLLKSSIWRFYLVSYSCEFMLYLCYIISMYDVQKDLNMISEQVQHEPLKIHCCCLNSKILHNKNYSNATRACLEGYSEQWQIAIACPAIKAWSVHFLRNLETHPCTSTCFHCKVFLFDSNHIKCIFVLLLVQFFIKMHFGCIVKMNLKILRCISLSNPTASQKEPWEPWLLLVSAGSV